MSPGVLPRPALPGGVIEQLQLGGGGGRAGGGPQWQRHLGRRVFVAGWLGGLRHRPHLHPLLPAAVNASVEAAEAEVRTVAIRLGKAWSM